MKKLLKFIAAVAAAAGIVLGVLYVFRDRLGFGEEMDSEDENDNDFEEVFADEMDDREYVTLDLDDEENGETDRETKENE